MTHSPALTIKPCPWCGEVPLWPEGTPGVFRKHCRAFCRTTNCRGDTTGKTFPTEDEAIVDWNRRAELAASADAGKLLLKMKVFRSDLDWELRTTPRNEERIKAPNVAIDEHLNQLAALARPAPATMATEAVSAQGDERAAFERWMVNDAKCIVGSTDPYPAGLERDYWKVWQAARAQVAQGDEADAARYRWLRDECREWEDMTSAWLYEGLDAAVDAARAQQGGQG